MKTKMMILGILFSVASTTAFAKEVFCSWDFAVATGFKHIDMNAFGDGSYASRVQLASQDGKDVSVQYSESAGITIHINDQKSDVSRYAGAMSFVEYVERGSQPLHVDCFTR